MVDGEFFFFPHTFRSSPATVTAVLPYRDIKRRIILLSCISVFLRSVGDHGESSSPSTSLALSFGPFLCAHLQGGHQTTIDRAHGSHCFTTVPAYDIV